MDNTYFYTTLATYLKKRFGKKLGKIGLSTKIPCPNSPRCIFCNERSFIPYTTDAEKEIDAQLIEGMRRQSKLYKTDSFIAYFQDATSTYGDKEYLYNLYRHACEYEQVKILCISTRPDYIDREILEIIKKAANGKEVWIELGLQTTHDTTLEKINRGHTYSQFLDAYNLIKNNTSFKIGIHMIVGLPDESEDMIYDSFEKINSLEPDFVKIHHLQVVKGSFMETMLSKQEYTPLEMNDYIRILSGCLCRLSKSVVIERILSDASKNMLLAPVWDIRKEEFKARLFDYMEKNNIYQSSCIK